MSFVKLHKAIRCRLTTRTRSLCFPFFSPPPRNSLLKVANLRVIRLVVRFFSAIIVAIDTRTRSSHSRMRTLAALFGEDFEYQSYTMKLCMYRFDDYM